MSEKLVAPLLERLGIEPSYGSDPYRPAYAETGQLTDVGPNVMGRMQALEPETASAWSAMKDAAADDGVVLLIVSGFRSIEYQARLIERKLARGNALTEILRSTAAPGFSQHHTGKAVDIATPGSRPLTEDFAATDAFAWLVNRANAFGFRMPYGRSNRFDFAYEPWHWSRIEV